MKYYLIVFLLAIGIGLIVANALGIHNCKRTDCRAAICNPKLCRMTP